MHVLKKARVNMILILPIKRLSKMLYIVGEVSYHICSLQAATWLLSFEKTTMLHVSYHSRTVERVPNSVSLTMFFVGLKRSKYPANST